MVQRSVTPRGDKNGADINLALDALEMAFTHNHINTFVIVSGDSDFMALVEKLKQYDKRVFVVGGRQFTSGILQRNCHEFISYENLLKAEGDTAHATRTQRTVARSAEGRSLLTAMPNIQRALQILAEREVAPQLGLLKSTLLQLDATFSERDYGAGSFLEFIQKLRKAGLVEMRRTDRGYLVEAPEGEVARDTAPEPAGETSASEAEPATETPPEEAPAAAHAAPEPAITTPTPVSPEATLAALRQALTSHFEKTPNRPLYLRQIRQLLRAAGSPMEERSGFRTLLDLLHQAQREGWLRLHRDRKGVWRVFPAVVSAPSLAPAVPAQAAVEAPPVLAGEIGHEVEPEIEPEADGEIEPDFLMPVEADVNWDAEIPPEEITELPEPAPAPPPVAIDSGEAPVQLPSPSKPRKPRGPRAGAKAPRRRASTRRKAKEPENFAQ